jgi:hypothetical protein
MRDWQTYAVAAIATSVLVAVACGGATTGGGGGGGNVKTACDDVFTVFIGSGCPGPGFPDAEVTRLRGRFETLCAEALALPGSSLTTSVLEACAHSGTSAQCNEMRSSACQFDTPGTLGQNASCQTNQQCQSDACTTGMIGPDGGTTLCGQCAAGTDCGGTTCLPGMACMNGFGNNPTCVPITYGDVGANCDNAQQALRCKAGLTCNQATSKCAPLGDVGAPCAFSTDCIGTLGCPAVGFGMSSTCQKPGGAGTRCTSDYECAPGLGCGSTSQTCATVTFVAAGQPCNDFARCTVGFCLVSGPGVSSICPAVIPDGQPCDANSSAATCDTFAQCLAGKCVLGVSSNCP